MIRSHSVSGDLHGMPSNPVAADILRREPEQEIFSRLKISPSGAYPIPFIIAHTMCFFGLKLLGKK